VLNFLTDLFKPKAPKAPMITSEANMSFGPEDIRPFLTRLLNNPRFGLPPELPNFVSDAMADIPEGGKQRWRIDGDFDGKWVQIEIEMAMDDPELPELWFFSTHGVIVEINAELTAFDAQLEH